MDPRSGPWGDLGAVKVAGTDNPADLLTKYLPAAEIHRHMDHLDFSLHDDRADAAPKLAAMTIFNDGSEGTHDHWIHGEEEVVRRHNRPRRELFTPLRVSGAPTVKALTSSRITVGVYCDTGERFRVADNWTSRGTAHRALSRRWTGATRFLKRSEADVRN